MDKKIDLFTTPTCHYCKLAKAFFQTNNLPYDEHDVVTDLAARQEMVQKSGQLGVPVIIVNDEIVVGFDETRLRSLLGI